MPAIKKKWMKTNMEENPMRVESDEDADDASVPIDPPVKSKPPVHSAPTTTMLKGLDGEVLSEKRKRFVPPAELKLSEWLDNNLEKRTEERIHLPLLYKYYTELCQASGSDILDVPKFNQMVKVKFGKSFGVQASSIYKAVIKEKKMGAKKKSGGVKMKEVVVDAINHFGNPWQGVRFGVLKNHVAAKYPALMIDAKPKVLKRALEMGNTYGYVEVTKGIGMMGSYRLPGAVEPPPKPKNEAKKEGAGETDGGDDAAEDGSGGGAAEGDGADKTKPAEGSEEAGKEEDSAAAKPKKPKKIQAWSYSKISYSNPAKIEDTFPLAITYQSAPKAATLQRIRRYILEKYGEEVTDSRWRKCLEHGVDKGFWEYVSGSGMSGRIHLLMDDFDPNSTQLEERICAAVIACHDPKSASANQIKKYVSRYHPDFNIDAKPERFKKALIRAAEKKMIRQLSGLGASGTFMLVLPFVPSPMVLAGEDDSDEEDDDSDYESAATYVPKGTKSRGRPKVKTMEVISPKKASASSSRGGRKQVVSPVTKKKGKPAGKGKNSGGSKKRNVRRSPSPLTDEEEDEEEEEDMVEYTPRKSQSRGGSGSSRNSSVSPSKAKSSSSKKGGKKPVSKPSTPKKKQTSGRASDGGKKSSPKKGLSPVVYLSNIDSEDDDIVDYTPKKSASRGGRSASSGKSKQNGTPRSPKKRKVESYSDEEEEDDDDDDKVEYTPRKSTSRGEGGRSSGAGKSKQNGTPKSPKKRKVESYSDEEEEEDDDDDDQVDYTPRKSTSRGGGSKANSSKKSTSAVKRKSAGGFDHDDDEDDYKRATPKSRGKSSSGKKKSRK